MITNLLGLGHTLGGAQAPWCSYHHSFNCPCMIGQNQNLYNQLMAIGRSTSTSQSAETAYAEVNTYADLRNQLLLLLE
jgi:hypothetical protein